MDPKRQDFYDRLAQHRATPLWEVMASLVPKEPTSPCVPALWPYEDLRPFLLEAGDLITAAEAVRRVLVLENPGMPGASSATRSLYAGLQVILPGETAPAHRHTQSALRFVVEGEGAFTAVDGERVSMYPGDYIITPSWTWHDHGNAGDQPVVWLDGLDLPVVALLDAGFAEEHEADSQAVGAGASMARFGSGLMPVDHKVESHTSPLFWFPYDRTRDAMFQLAKSQDVDECHGHRMRFVNPVTGGWTMPTMGTFMQMFPAGFDGAGHRSTDGQVYSVIEGCGEVRVGAETFEFGPRDHFVVPSWHERAFRASEDTILFSFSDRPMQEALDLFREQR